MVYVIGCGAIGLMTCLDLLDHGLPVTLISATSPQQTAGFAAGGITLPTFPFEPSSDEFQARIRWRLESLEFLSSYGRGKYVETLPHVEFFKDGVVEGQVARSVLVDNVDVHQSGSVILDRQIFGFSEYVSFDVLGFNAVGLLTDLYDEVLRRGVHHVTKSVTSRDLAALQGTVFNCTGYGAKELLGDIDVRPVFGQGIRFGAQEDHFSVGLGDFFVMSSRWGTYVGSPFIFDVDDLTPRDDWSNLLLEFSRVTFKSIAEILALRIDLPVFDKPIDTVCGIRPYRPKGLRLEIEDRGTCVLIHNYGHGAHGWTVGWGTVKEAMGRARERGLLR